jgi:hypothetical protein
MSEAEDRGRSAAGAGAGAARSKPALDQAKAILGALPRETLEELRTYLADLLPDARTVARAHRVDERDEARAPAVRGGGARPGTRALRKEWTRCGKPTCSTCKSGKGHGPYLYEYWRENGRLRKRYVGLAKSL